MKLTIRVIGIEYFCYFREEGQPSSGEASLKERIGRGDNPGLGRLLHSTYSSNLQERKTFEGSYKSFTTYVKANVYTIIYFAVIESQNPLIAEFYRFYYV